MPFPRVVWLPPGDGGTDSPVSRERETELDVTYQSIIPRLQPTNDQDELGSALTRAWGATIAGGVVTDNPDDIGRPFFPPNWGVPRAPEPFVPPDGFGSGVLPIGDSLVEIGPTITFGDFAPISAFPSTEFNPGMSGPSLATTPTPSFVAPQLPYFCPPPPSAAAPQADEDVDLGVYGMYGIGWSAPFLKEANGQRKDGEVYTINEGYSLGFAQDLGTALLIANTFFSGSIDVSELP